MDDKVSQTDRVRRVTRWSLTAEPLLYIYLFFSVYFNSDERRKLRPEKSLLFVVCLTMIIIVFQPALSTEIQPSDPSCLTAYDNDKIFGFNLFSLTFFVPDYEL